MIDIPRDVAARAAINRPFGIHAKEILAIAFIDLFIGNARPGVFGDPFSFGNRLQGKQAEPVAVRRTSYFPFPLFLLTAGLSPCLFG